MGEIPIDVLGLPDLSEATVAAYGLAGVGLAESWLCFNPLTVGDQQEVPVGLDGHTIRFQWARNVDLVTVDGESILFTVHSQRAVSSGDCLYYCEARLVDRVEPGTLVTVEGDYGFTDLEGDPNVPAPLVALIAAATRYLAQQASGQAWETSKSIEDVSVSQTVPTMDALVATWRPIISRYSLCDAMTGAAGSISVSPSTVDRSPWWVSPVMSGQIGR